jgi:hypothetical protein
MKTGDTAIIPIVEKSMPKQNSQPDKNLTPSVTDFLATSSKNKNVNVGDNYLEYLKSQEKNNTPKIASDNSSVYKAPSDNSSVYKAPSDNSSVYKTPSDYKYKSNEYQPPTYTPPPPAPKSNLNIKEFDFDAPMFGQNKYPDHIKINPTVEIKPLPKLIPKSIPKFDIPKYAPDPFRDNPAIVKTPLSNPGRDAVLSRENPNIPSSAWNP